MWDLNDGGNEKIGSGLVVNEMGRDAFIWLVEGGDILEIDVRLKFEFPAIRFGPIPCIRWAYKKRLSQKKKKNRGKTE